MAGRASKPLLYYDDLNPHSRCVLMLLKLLNVDVELRYVDLLKGEHLKAGFAHINPARTVPVMVHHTITITDSHAILMYICDNFAGEYSRQLLPNNCYKKRLRIYNKLFFEASILHRRHGQLMTDLVRKTKAGTDMVFHEKRVKSAYDALEGFLHHGPFMAGNTLTIADMAMVATVGALDMMFPIVEDRTRWKNLHDWHKRMKAMPVHKVNYNGIEKQREVVELFGRFEFPSTLRRRSTAVVRQSKVPRLTLSGLDDCNVEGDSDTEIKAKSQSFSGGSSSSHQPGSNATVKTVSRTQNNNLSAKTSKSRESGGQTRLDRLAFREQSFATETEHKSSDEPQQDKSLQKGLRFDKQATSCTPCVSQATGSVRAQTSNDDSCAQTTRAQTPKPKPSTLSVATHIHTARMQKANPFFQGLSDRKPNAPNQTNATTELKPNVARHTETLEALIKNVVTHTQAVEALINNVASHKQGGEDQKPNIAGQKRATEAQMPNVTNHIQAAEAQSPNVAGNITAIEAQSPNVANHTQPAQAEMPSVSNQTTKFNTQVSNVANPGHANAANHTPATKAKFNVAKRVHLVKYKAANVAFATHPYVGKTQTPNVANDAQLSKIPGPDVANRSHEVKNQTTNAANDTQLLKTLMPNVANRAHALKNQTPNVANDAQLLKTHVPIAINRAHALKNQLPDSASDTHLFNEYMPNGANNAQVAKTPTSNAANQLSETRNGNHEHVSKLPSPKVFHQTKIPKAQKRTAANNITNANQAQETDAQVPAAASCATFRISDHSLENFNEFQGLSRENSSEDTTSFMDSKESLETNLPASLPESVASISKSNETLCYGESGTSNSFNDKTSTSCSSGCASSVQFQRLNIQPNGIQNNGIQTNGIKTNGIQTNVIQTNGVQNNGTQNNAIQTNGIQTNGIKTNGVQANGIQNNGIQTNGVKTNGIQTNAIQNNGIQTNGIKTNGIQANGIQNNGIQTNGIKTNGIQTNAVQTNGIQNNGTQNNGTLNNGTQNNGNQNNGIKTNGIQTNAIQTKGIPNNGTQNNGIKTNGIQTNAIQTNGIQNNGTQNNGIQTNSIKTNGIQTNGIQNNGIQNNGIQTNGIRTNGIQANGFQNNGIQSNGIKTNGIQNGIQNNGIQANGIQNNGIQNNGIQTYGIQTYGIQNNGIQNNGNKANGLQASGIQNNGIQINGIQTYGIETYGMQTNGIQTNGIKANGLQASGIHNNGIQTYDIQTYGIDTYGIETYGVQTNGIQNNGIQTYGIENFSFHTNGPEDRPQLLSNAIRGAQVPDVSNYPSPNNGRSAKSLSRSPVGRRTNAGNQEFGSKNVRPITSTTAKIIQAFEKNITTTSAAGTSNKRGRKQKPDVRPKGKTTK